MENHDAMPVEEVALFLSQLLDHYDSLGEEAGVPGPVLAMLAGDGERIVTLADRVRVEAPSLLDERFVFDDDEDEEF